MSTKRMTLLVAIMASLAAAPLALSSAAQGAEAIQVKEGYYKSLVDYEFMRQNVDIPPKKGVMIIDSRPAARQYDPGHIPGAVNIPDTQFDKQVAKLPADKSTLLLFYCGGLDCMLSHTSAMKAEKAGYSNIKVYPAGMPEWKAKGGPVSVSAAYIKKLIDDKTPHMLIDARPKRVAWTRASIDEPPWSRAGGVRGSCRDRGPPSRVIGPGTCARPGARWYAITPISGRYSARRSG